VYAGTRVPAWKLRAGLLLYDALSLFRNVANHSGLSAAEVLEREPGLRRDGLAGGAVYHDAATDDARLTLANALAAAEAGAVVVNHAAVRALLRDRGRDSARVVGAVVDDVIGGEQVEVRARVVVNATGPWADTLRRQEDASAPPAVRGTKGVHILVPRTRLGNRGALTLLSPLDGRVMFALPAGAFALVGTTDTATGAAPDDVRASEADVAYLLRSANAFFPTAALTRSDVLSAWAGIRPLVASGYKANGGTASASREHAIDRGPGGVLGVSGGKLTTYRSMSAEVVDAAERALGRRPSRPRTADVPLPGGDLTSLEAEESAARARVGRADVAARLVSAFGTRWREVWRLAEGDPALSAPVWPGLPYVGAELAYAADQEMASTLADLLVRRTHLAFETGDMGAAAASSVAALVAPRLGWDAARVSREVERYGVEAGRLFGVDAE